MIDKEIWKFKNLKEEIDTIKAGSIISFWHFPLLQESSWKDFELEFPETFNRIRELSEKKEKYNKGRKTCKSLIQDVLKIAMEDFKEFLIELMKKDKNKMDPKIFFEKEILKDLAEWILSKEKEGGRYVKEIFEKFMEKWLKIREEENISNKIKDLIGLATQMGKYADLGEELEKEKKELMRKYYISYGDIE